MNSTETNQTAVDPKTQWNKEQPAVLVFDVNETLIDFESLNPLFEKVFGDKRVLREWLGHLIMYSMTLTLSGLYENYFDLGQGLLQMVGKIRGVDVPKEDLEAIRTGMLTMPAHPDVLDGLKRLKEQGLRLVSLTNSPPNPNGQSPLEQAGLGPLFERQFSIDTVRAYKPASLVYHMVARELDVPPSACCMVAAHVWDTVGAQSAGFSAALITRPGNAPLMIPGLPQPNFVAPDLIGLAERLAGRKAVGTAR